MANSPLVSLRVPPETLARIDRLAQKLYPARRAGRSPNRSQVILDAIEQFLAQHEVLSTEEITVAQRSEQSMDASPQGESLNDEHINQALRLQPDELQKHPGYVKPSMRGYIDWWSDYFSYLKKFTDYWLKTK